MKFAKSVKNQLALAGKKVYLSDGEWISTPFKAVVEQTWRKNKTNFEDTFTAAGLTSADYFVYIGPYDRNIMDLSENCIVIQDNDRYCFKKREKVEISEETVYYWGILRKLRGAETNDAI